MIPTLCHGCNADFCDKLEWPRWWGLPWDIKNREHIEIKVMQDIAGDAKASRCVFIRGSEHSPELYSMLFALILVHPRMHS